MRCIVVSPCFPPGAGVWTGRSAIPGVRKIAVLRVNGLGDFVFALPALDAIRAAYPKAEMVYFGSHWHGEFLSGRPGPVDRVVVVPPMPGFGTMRNQPADTAPIERFLEAMRAEQFDLALQMHGGGRHSNPLVRALGARITAGFQAEDALPLDVVVPYVYAQHEVMRFLELAERIGAPQRGLEPSLQVIERDLREASAVMDAHSGRLVALSPGASDRRRRWPPAKFAAVGDVLADAGARVVITGDMGDRPLARDIVGRMRRRAQDLSGRLSIGGLAGPFSQCALVVSNDSGPLHLASAVGTPTVGIYWFINTVTAGPLTVERHRPVLSWRTQCPDRGAACIGTHCEHVSSLVADVEVAGVNEKALALLGERAPAEAGFVAGL